MLDKAAHIHDRHLVADMAHDGEIVGDDEVGQAQFALQPRQEIEDFALHRDIEAGRRLVGDDELRRQRKRAATPTRRAWPPESWCG